MPRGSCSAANKPAPFRGQRMGAWHTPPIRKGLGIDQACTATKELLGGKSNAAAPRMTAFEIRRLKGDGIGHTAEMSAMEKSARFSAWPRAAAFAANLPTTSLARVTAKGRWAPFPDWYFGLCPCVHERLLCFAIRRDNSVE